ncbi:hypothetical protein L345_09952, partial [Ophiophagus hannah]
ENKSCLLEVLTEKHDVKLFKGQRELRSSHRAEFGVKYCTNSWLDKKMIPEEIVLRGVKSLLFFCYAGIKGEQITFSFTDDGIRVKTEGCEEIVFPNRLGLNLIDYLAVDGDFRIKSVTFP